MKTPEEIEAAEDAKLDEFLKTKREDNRLVTVCDACHMASCWRGIFMCCRHCGSTEIEPLEPWVWWCKPCRWFVRL